MERLSQRDRVISLGLDLLVLFIICFITFGNIFPPLGDHGFWFYTALLAVLIGSKIVTPFYVKPVDAISYSVPAFISLMLVNKWSSWPLDTKVIFFVVSFIAGAVFLTALITIVLNNSVEKRIQLISNNLRVILELVAKPQFIYSPIIIFSMFAYHMENPKELILISVALLLTVASSSGDLILITYRRILSRTSVGKKISNVAEIAAYQQPKIILLRQNINNQLAPKTLVCVRDRLANTKIMLTLDQVGRDNGVLIRCVEIATIPKGKYGDLEFSIMLDSAAVIENDYLEEICRQENIDISLTNGVVGIVAPETTIERLYFEVVDNENLQEGRLVSVRIQGKKILYQIVAGLTKEEVVFQKNTYGYLRAQAQQIGVWDSENVKFHQFDWLPLINSAVYLEEQQDYEMELDTIGHFPDSNYQVKIGNINQLVTHNTAILGILGVGKSMLAIELIERMMAEGIKVVCLDLTDQYARELSDYYYSIHEQKCIKALHDASEKDRDVWQESPEEGGSLPNLKAAFYSDLESFLENTDGHLLKIYNPADFVATRQDRAPNSFQSGGQWQRGAAMFSVTPVEITKIVSETVLNILSKEMADKAKVCLVYEEAHSLIPEWNSVVNEGDRNATSGSARAILQGRKFGLGCLLVTQRTANVTKTILNQCNTIFAMRTFDDTGKDFMSNYIGRDYAETLSSIKERHAVFFGRGSSCENPVLMKVNDRAEFLKTFREVHSAPDFDKVYADMSEPELGPVPEASEHSSSQLDDEIPF